MEASVFSLAELHHFSPNLGFPISNPNSSCTLSCPSKPSSIATRKGRLKLGFPTNLRASVSNSLSETQQYGTSSTIGGDKESVGSVNPVYIPTPPNRELRTPHSGYHFDGSVRKFFEGWYFKVSIPERRQSFCFMYSVENPAFRNKLTPLEVAQHGPRFTGVGAQILGANDKYICQYTEESQNFWGSRHELILGNTFIPQKQSKPPNKEVPPQEFNRRVSEGFQVTPLWHQGFIRDDGRSDYVETVKTARWEYSTRPVYGWGDVGSQQKSTAGWLAAFPVFEPHWQICMAGGLSTGWIEWDGERIEFENAPSYSEKNWGGAFPRKWFWICIHFDGKFYEFVPWNGVVNWEVAPWGCWCMGAENETHLVELEATTEDSGTTLRAPTSEAGLAPACKDTCFGLLRLQMWERKYDGSKGKIILDVTSDMAALEVGGGPWFNTWKGKTTTPELLSQALRVPIDVDGFFNLLPLFKPPGL
ncbi:tocopherol cyclase, chloroplastic-like isoform X2 [Ziziphus jujuba]|uniref:Tocopherol cyclase, chloroplastic-like isoform X2 n=1 Tax=Ziziphus jujuba TaxID=326968 RepID=A0ABM3IMU0_ZIZJJ|nr:tocopherol cyclase, chloroplastic-like isoform X2 [Ziziphus jujuba]